ncbi:hypothetical protein Tco_1569113 [Tanacetum coccineum]
MQKTIKLNGGKDLGNDGVIKVGWVNYSSFMKEASFEVFKDGSFIVRETLGTVMHGMSSHQHGSGASLPNQSQSAAPTTGGYPTFFNQYGATHQQQPFQNPPYEPATLPQFRTQALASAPPNPPLTVGGYGAPLPPPNLSQHYPLNSLQQVQYSHNPRTSVHMPMDHVYPQVSRQQATTALPLARGSGNPSGSGSSGKRKADNIQRFEFENMYGNSIEAAANGLNVQEADFIKRANQLALYEWVGVNGKSEKITHRTTNIKEEIFVRLMIEGKDRCEENDTMIALYVPTTATFDQFKTTVRDAYPKMHESFPGVINSGLSWKLGDKWAQLTDCQAWHVLVKAWYITKREYFDIRYSVKKDIEAMAEKLTQELTQNTEEGIANENEATGATANGRQVNPLMTVNPFKPDPNLASLVSTLGIDTLSLAELFKFMSRMKTAIEDCFVLRFDD